jgi:hypothetical protein
MGIPCLNCSKDVAPEAGKLFAACFLCGDCFTIAERAYERGRQELQWMLTTLQELLRLAIVNHKLSPPSTEEGGRAEVVTQLAALAQQARATCPTNPTKTSSNPTTPRSVRSAGGLPDLSHSTPALGSVLETPSTQTPVTVGQGNVDDAPGTPS